MNREIKFRAIHKSSNTMVHGNLLVGVDFDGDQLVQIEHTDPNDFQQWIVIPETVGQYTGLEDKNGKEIYEGDIVRYKEFERFREGESVHVSVVKYYCEPNSRVGFEPMVWHTKVEDGYYNSELEDYEVIGNVFENPELLEGK